MPRPEICGKTYQIQWLRFRPDFISPSAVSYSPPACASTNRSRDDPLMAVCFLLARIEYKLTGRRRHSYEVFHADDPPPAHRCADTGRGLESHRRAGSL